MLKTIYGTDPKVNEAIRIWVSQQLDMEIAKDGKCHTIGVFDVPENPADAEIIAAIVFHDYRGHMVEGSLATTDRRWCQKGVIKAFMNYPFEVLKVKRFHAITARSNKKMRKLFDGLGFKYEGCARKAYDGVHDAMIYSILDNESKWLKV